MDKHLCFPQTRRLLDKYSPRDIYNAPEHFAQVKSDTKAGHWGALPPGVPVTAAEQKVQSLVKKNVILGEIILSPFQMG